MKYLVKVLALNAGKTIYRSGDVVSGGVFGTERLAELLKGGYIEAVSDESAELVEDVVEVEEVAEVVTEEVSEAAAEVPAAEQKPKAKKSAEKKTEEPAVNLGDVNLL